MKCWLIGKDFDAGRNWGQEEKGTTEDEMAGWHHGLDGRESEWTPGVGDGQGGLACCDSWGHKESDTTERLNWTELNTHKQNFHGISTVKKIHKGIFRLFENPCYILTHSINNHWKSNPIVKAIGQGGERDRHSPQRHGNDELMGKWTINKQHIQ